VAPTKNSAKALNQKNNKQQPQINASWDPLHSWLDGCSRFSRISVYDPEESALLAECHIPQQE
jgi:hypothetical protein